MRIALLFWATFEGNRMKFSDLFILQLFAFSCYLYIFNRFYQEQQLRKSHRYHVIVLLSISFLFFVIVVSLMEAYMFTAHVFQAAELFCSLRTWIHYSLNIINLFLVAFASIEWQLFEMFILLFGQVNSQEAYR
jgi:hypothetical protein